MFSRYSRVGRLAGFAWLVFHCAQGVARGRGQWAERRIVLHDVDRTLPRQRNLHAGIEDPGRIECLFDYREPATFVGAPDSIHERSSKPAVAVLARERPV